MAEPAIVLDDLTKYYGRRLGVAGLTFDVGAGEVVGFLGPNGAGKTTAMRMLVGLLRITRGRARILGQDVSGAPPALRQRIGYLPGALALYPNLTGRELLRFLARMRGLDLGPRIDELAERLDLDLSRHVHDLSKGNQQKVGVVQAFMHDPDVLILDEPTSGLDPIVQREFGALVREATGRGASMLLSSHVLSEVEELADRVAVVDQGALVVVERIGILKERTVRTVDMVFDSAVDPAPFAALPGVTDVVASGVTVGCRVIGPETELLRQAVALGVVRVSTREANLEEIFLSLVGGGEDRGAAPADEVVA